MCFDLPRGDRISPEARTTVLNQFGLLPADLLAKGTEAEVYALSENSILKIYSGNFQTSRFEKIQSFLNSLQVDALPFAVPTIHNVKAFDDLICLIEQKIPGSQLPAKYSTMDTFLSAAMQVGAIPVPDTINHYLLLGNEDWCATASGDWYSFFFSMIQKAVVRNHKRFVTDIFEFNEKYSLVEHVFFKNVYTSQLALIHGDLFPGNVLVAADMSVTGVIDFGTFTMFGDPLYDIATACIFFEMYSEDRFSIRDSLLAKVQHLVAAHSHPWLYRYILGCAFISADLYHDDSLPLVENGHYQWALEILNDHSLWSRFSG